LRREPVEIRILVALESDYRAYREVIAAAIRVLRPHAEVATSGLDALEEEIARVDPHVVICSLPATTMGSGNRVAWVKLSVDPRQSTLICIRGQYSEVRNPMVETLLGVVDEAERLVAKEESKTGGC
jgi:hypothetical protein